MFGFGGKERSLVAEISPEIESAVNTKDVGSLSYSQEILKEFYLLAEEYDVLRSIRKATAMPGDQKKIYDQRIKDCESRMKGIHHAAKVINAGYSPLTVSDQYYVGGVEKKVGGWQFRVPMPPAVLTKYQDARESGLFVGIVVASPNPDHFNKTPSIRVDPIMLGFIKRMQNSDLYIGFRDKWTNQQYTRGFQTEDYPGFRLENGESFLIAQWDLSQDLKSLSSK